MFDNYQDYNCNVDADPEQPSPFHSISLPLSALLRGWQLSSALLRGWQLSVSRMITSKKSCWPSSRLAALDAGWTLLGKLLRWKRGSSTLPWVTHSSLYDDDHHVYIWRMSYVWWSSYMAWTLYEWSTSSWRWSKFCPWSRSSSSCHLVVMRALNVLALESNNHVQYQIQALRRHQHQRLSCQFISEWWWSYYSFKNSLPLKWMSWDMYIHMFYSYTV